MTTSEQSRMPVFGWSRWLLLGGVSGVVAGWCAFGLIATLLLYIFPPTAVNSSTPRLIALVRPYIFVGSLVLAVLGSGALGGALHWRLVGRPPRQRFVWMGRWAVCFVVCVFLFSSISFVLGDPLNTQGNVRVSVIVTIVGGLIGLLPASWNRSAANA